MFPSIVSDTATTTHSYNAAQGSTRPITAHEIVKNSELMHILPDCNHRVTGNLFWLEHDKTPELNSRVDFINKLTSSILEASPIREKPITLVSLHSHGLLIEYFIHKQLEKLGYQDINWRIIDSNYQDNGLEESRKEFKEKTGGKLKAFTTEQTYFKKTSDVACEKLASNDKHRGTVVILSINSPAPIVSIDDVHKTLGGAAVKDINKANAIYLMFTLSEHGSIPNVTMNGINPVNAVYEMGIRGPIHAMSEMLSVTARKVNDAIGTYHGTKTLSCENILKCSVNTKEGYSIDCSQTEENLRIKKGINLHLKNFNYGDMRNSDITLPHINGALVEYIELLSQKPELKLLCTKLLVSDYDNSIIELNDFFINDSHHKTLFASYDANQKSFEIK
ncbi:hypothetical protein [Klebsiella sp. BIGb0407]|uniref:hypothetical protein n=1 Tax=Klebsiella sp. BIGb0407 TaxID=2940603 RepID=UPI002168A071|nr:hypothetical protein [Klebsiella sp. BIGb0407]MCS3429965.1 hypothetical protein [Klebsiella sp. BIGb0407]